jgi:hypothetical protein
MDELKTNYIGVDITYHEGLDQWVFELGGRERSAKTLREARQAIESAPKQKKAATRFQAYLVGFMGNSINEVTVGAASEGYRGDPKFWVSNNGTRSKERAVQLMKVNEHNQRLVAEWQRLKDQIEQLIKERSQTVAAMERIDIPVDDQPA